MLKMKINRNKIIIFLSIIFFFIPTLVRAEPLKLGGSDSINTSTTSSMGDGISDVMGIALSIPEYAELVLDRINQTLQIFLKDGEYLLIQKTVPIVDANSGLLVASKYEQYIQSVKAIVSGIDKFESSQININGSGVKYVEFVAKNPFSSFKLLVFTDPNYDYQVIVIEEKAAPMSEQVLNLLNSIQFSLSGQPTSQEGSDGIAMQNSTQDIANLPVPLYKQNDPAWSCEQIGTCTCASAKCGFPNTTTIGDIGCYLTSQSMMFQYFTYGTYKNPSQYNQCLKEVNGFLTTAACNQGKCGLPYNRTVPGCTPSTVSFHKYYTLSTGPLNLALIDDDLRAGYPVLGGMEGHYFVIIGKQGTDYVVNDPIGGLRTRAPSVLINFSLYRGPMPYPDIVKPVTTISLNGVVGENYWYKSHVTMILNATDDRTGIREIQYSYDNENWYSYPYSPVQLNRIGLEVPIYYRAIDNAGNVEDVKVTYYNSDPIAPSNPTSVNPGCGAVSGEWQNACSDPNFSWSGASDDTSGLSLYQYYWGPDPFGTTGTTTSDSLYDPPPVTDGTYHLRIATKDVAGNWSDWQTLFTLRYDHTVPTGSLAIKNNWSVTDQALVILNMNATDSASGVGLMRLRDGGGSWTEWKAYSPSAQWVLPPLTGQTHSVEVQYKDLAGNTSPTFVDTILFDIYPDHPSSPNFHLYKSTFGVSATNAESTSYHLTGTLGQLSATGYSQSPAYRITSGYWSWINKFVIWVKNYLPVIAK